MTLSEPQPSPELTPHRTRIKICGLTREADVDAAVAAGADAIGLVLYARSPRAVSVTRAGELARRLPPFVTPVLLFVNAEPGLVTAALDQVPHAMLQFHGDETPQACEQWQRPYLRAVRMNAQTDLLDCQLQYATAQALLVDADSAGYGGGGKVFDWSWLPPSVSCPLVLSGGLHAANVMTGIRQVRPWAVDVSSGVESAKGIKDAQAMRQFCWAVRQADAAVNAG